MQKPLLYRSLVNNSKSAMIAAIEIYNKPQFSYRDECFVVLLINSWELLLKAILSRKRRKIFYDNKNPDKGSLTLVESLEQSKKYFPPGIPFEPVQENLKALAKYRNRVMHLYNEIGFSVLIYGLSQTSIVNYSDLLDVWFDIKLASETNLTLLPLGLGTPLDPIQFLSNEDKTEKSPQVSSFIDELADATRNLELLGIDTARLMTVFSVKLESVKKVTNANIVMGVTSEEESPSRTFVIKTFDPNDPSWVRRKDILSKVTEVHDIPFNSHVFEAIVWKHDIKLNSRYCWRDRDRTLTKYSLDVIPYIKRLTKEDIKTAIIEYRMRSKKS